VGSVIGVPDNYIFTFSPLVAPLLKGHNVDIVNIGNNHTLNFGRDGLVQTKKFLTDAGVLYFGDPDVTESDRVLRTSVNGVSISFVNWSDWTSDNTDITGNQIKSEVASGRTVVVYTHWGQEYVPVIERVRALAHQFIDDGASIVIGSHPHIVQEHEVYKGRHIYYSLGNFIFDQYWNAEVSHGLTLDTTLTESGVVEIREFPVELLPDGRTCFVEK
jgi:poly-gamma-glutamate synthesis protein (capsule biosynthesis protein)